MANMVSTLVYIYEVSLDITEYKKGSSKQKKIYSFILFNQRKNKVDCDNEEKEREKEIRKKRMKRKGLVSNMIS